jgi:8-amino-7-oxononanoate synthase
VPRARLPHVEEPERRQRLFANIATAREDLSRAAGSIQAMSSSQFHPVILGDDARALGVARELREYGFDVRAIRPPTVPEGTARLRIAVNASHTRENIAALADALRAVLSRNPE